MQSVGALLIAQERTEQIFKHGFNESDDDYENGELIEAALFAIDPISEFSNRWPVDWEVPFQQKIVDKDRIDQLKVAGAFIAAEIDRQLRLVSEEQPPLTFEEAVTTEAIYESGIDLFGDPIEIIPTPNADFSLSLIDLEKERLAWSLETFTEATPISSLRKLETEIDEIERNIENGIKDPIEYADAMMCLLDSAGRDGISVEVILKAFELKLKVNKEREWVKNDDNSYSHIKPE